MSRPTATSRSHGLGAARRRCLTASAGAVAALAVVSSVAGAAVASRVVSEASNSTLKENVVVDGHGRTLYALHPESIHHVLCRSRSCFEAWPPLTVRSASVKLEAGHGVEGRLGLLHRSDGKLQVTLRGMPLYRFAGDSAKGQASGEGIRTFGGTWHAVKAEAHSPAAPTGTTSPTTNTPPMTPPAYGY
jgi:predicted lipoprotein with Yx(FWY)xxD motif